ncbi:MAG: hypothetical protein RIG63_13815 [Coleofasciculus chthonoplastes F3-SA18-01]|uniref:hypothetical protein n=1 Tax=Coleofasciculus chthonoplastes TaxID=64178 RepID=UPI0032FC965B
MWNNQNPPEFEHDGVPHSHHPQRDGADEKSPDTEQESLDPNLSPEHIKATKKSLKRIYITLLIMGLLLGGVVSVGVVIALDRMGLTDAPADVEETEMPY